MNIEGYNSGFNQYSMKIFYFIIHQDNQIDQMTLKDKIRQKIFIILYSSFL